MVFEGELATDVNIAQTKAKVGTDAEVFPFPAVGGQVFSWGGDRRRRGGDPQGLEAGAQALLTWLASTDAAKIRAGLLPAVSSRRTRAWATSAYPNNVQRNHRPRHWSTAGNDIRFDMSDQAPQSFGGTPGKG